jgi:WD40 repeat protein
VEAEVFQGHQFGIESLALAPDGCFAATGDSSGVVFLWDLCASEPTGRQIWPDNAATTAEDSQANETVVNSLEFSQDGKYLAAGFGRDSNGYMVLWKENRTGFGDILLQTEPTGAILDVGFSPDNKWLASGSADNRVRLYPLDNVDKPYILQRTDVDILNISYSPDSRWLVIGGFENVIRLWDLSARNPSGQSLELLSDTSVYVIAMDPQGQFLASGTRDPNKRGENSPDNPVRLWSIDTESLYQAACQSTGRNFTSAEWDFYFPDEPYHKTCDQWP